MTSKKVFGIVSYFPNNDTEYHIETRRERSRRCSELLLTLEKYWPEIDILIIAQNWQDFTIPNIKNKVIRYDYDKLGITGARRELRSKFLESQYDYLIMLDDDGIISCEDPSIYMNEIDNHPDGIGVIRHTACPLMLLAISKYVYSKIDIPDIEAEKGQTFEDDLFVARCFAQFPDKAFDFPKDCVTETSFKYTGEGACPSTWARENNYDWEGMRRVSKALIDAASRKEFKEDNKDNEIDIVIPYVDASDKHWRSDFSTSTGIYSISGVRFRSWGTLKYLFRSIAENMTFVRNIILLVSRESQVPEWINRDNVRIVLHKDFIPKEFLPTFNSCTIECFLYRISDLSEKFIYFNDDMFVLNKMNASDFFTEGKPHIKFLYHDSYANNLYRYHCRNALDMIANALKAEKYPVGKLVCPEHTPSAMLKSTVDKVGDICNISIRNSISKLRMKQNLNQYMYHYYEFYTNNYIDDLYTYLYIEVKDKLDTIRYVIKDSEIQLLCLNDSDKIKDYKKVRHNLIDIFEEKFPNKCKYEI